jgi:hypothetical protein
MIFDANGRPVSAPPAPGAPNAHPATRLPDLDAPPGGDAEQMERRLHSLNVARLGLRALLAQSQNALLEGAANCTLPVAMVETLLLVGSTALDAFLDARCVNEHGVIEPLPGSTAAHGPLAVLRLVDAVNAFAEDEPPAPLSPIMRQPSRQERRALERLRAQSHTDRAL